MADALLPPRVPRVATLEKRCTQLTKEKELIEKKMQRIEKSKEAETKELRDKLDASQVCHLSVGPPVRRRQTGASGGQRVAGSEDHSPAQAESAGPALVSAHYTLQLLSCTAFTRAACTWCVSQGDVRSQLKAKDDKITEVG